MSHVDSGPLAAYNSLQDKHLVGYFNNTRMRRHLRRSGLVRRNGEIVTESSFRLSMARREHQKHVRDLLAQAIVHKALDMERHRQAEIKKKLEEISKVELVQRVRSSKGRMGDEDITPYLSPRAPSSGRPKSAKQERPRSVASVHRPATAPSKQSGTNKKKSAVYVDQEGFPVHRDQAWGSVDSDNNEVDSHNLRELDPYLLNDITLNMTREEKQTSPYNVDLTFRNPKPPPRPPQGPKKSPRGPSSRTLITRDGRRIGSKSNKRSLSLHRKEPAYPHPTQQQTMCDVTVRYRGNNLKLQYEREDRRDEVIINQQHCGGENLVVFHGLVEPGTDLVFTSRRHRGFPFSLTFFVNQIQVLRLSACCEFKYGPGVILGGRKGHFKFGRVDGGSPCYRCMVEAELARRERQRYKDTQTDEPKPEKTPDPVLETQGTQSDPPPPEVTREQSQQANEAATANYDDEEFEEEDDKGEADSERDTTKTEDKNSDHFFSGPESDAERRQSAGGYEADSDFEVDSSCEEQAANEKDDVNVQEKIQEEQTAESDVPEETPKEPIEGEASDHPEDVATEEVPEEPDDAVLVPEDAILVPEDTILVPESPYKSEDERQSSRHDSDSGSDSGGHNRVLSTSSSSSSSSEDDDEKSGVKATQEANISTSDFSSEDERGEKKKHIKQEKQGMEESPVATKNLSDGEETKKLEDENTKQNTDKGKDVQPDINAPDESKAEIKMQSSSAKQDADSASEVGSTKEEIKENDGELRNAEDQKDDKSFLSKLADKVKDVFTSSDSSSSESDKDYGKKRGKKKKKSKSKSDSSEKSLGSSDTDNSKSFIEKFKAKFASSDSDSDSSSDNAKNGKRKSDSEKSDATNVATPSRDVESKESERQDIKSVGEQDKNQRLQEDEEPRPSLSGGRKDEEDNKNKEENADKPKSDQKALESREEDEDKDWIGKTDGQNKDIFGSTDSEDNIDKKEKAEPSTDEEIALPKKTKDGKQDGFEVEDDQRASYSQLDREPTNEAEGTKTEDKDDAESDTSSQKQDERPKSPEPPKDDDTTEIFQEREVRTDDMFGPTDSDSDSKSGSEKIEVREDIIEAEEEIPARAARQNQEVEETMSTITEEKEDGMKDIQRASDSEQDRDSAKQVTFEVDVEAHTSSEEQEERPNSPEPPEDEHLAENIPNPDVTINMFGLSDSDTDSKSDTEKSEVKEVINADDDPEAKVIAPQNQEERPNTPEPPEDEHLAENISKPDVTINMFGPSDSDSDSKSDSGKSEVKKTIKAEDDPEAKVAPKTQEETEEPMSTLHEEGDVKDEKADSPSIDKDRASNEQSDEASQAQDEASLDEERKEDEKPEEVNAVSDEQSHDEASRAQDDASSDGERKTDEKPEEDNAASDEQTDDKNSQTGASDSEKVTGQQEATETEQDKPEDEVDGRKDLKEDNASITSRSSLSDSGSIADGLENNLRVLNLNAKGLNEDKVPKLARALKRQKYRNLEYLLLRDNPLTDTGIATVTRALVETHNKATSAESALKLTHFDLGNSGMGDEAAAELGKLLALPNIRLQDLNISENLLSAAGWAQVIEGLKVNESLIKFTAEYAHLSDTSCVMLADALADHETLQELNIEGNGLGERAGNALTHLVKDNSIITSISLEKDNVMSANIVSEVKEILETGSYVP